MAGTSGRLRRAAAGGLLCAASAAAALLGGCSAKEQADKRALAEGRPCYVEGMSGRAACHSIEVPEDWSKPQGRKIALNVALLPAAGINKDGSALFVLAGGPGQAATHYGDLINQELDRVQATRPVILMDQRGTGGSNGLKCAFGGASLAEVQAQSSGKELEECRKRWGNTALQHYTTPDVVRDIEAVRKRLGYDKLDLWGASWGTRTALLYMRQFPKHVRSAVLDGVTGPNSPLFANEAKYAQAALDKLLDDCAAERNCAAAFPNLKAKAVARLQQETAQPVQYIGGNGRIATMSMDPDMLRQIVRGALYSPDTAARIPFALDRLVAGDATPLMAIANSATGFNRETMFRGATFSSLCAEEMPRVSPEEAQRASAGSFARDSFYRSWAEGCAGWPVKPLPAGYGDPVKTDVPVLLLSGGIDPVTPPASANAVQAHLPRVWHIVAPYSGHNVTAIPCAGRVIADFITRADGAALDARCLTRRKRPPFMVTPLGPKA
jgi:pimeloyl-ACP methyl ester carboxylesterase